MHIYDFLAKNVQGRYLEIGVNAGGSMIAALSRQRVTMAVGIDNWSANFNTLKRQEVLDAVLASCGPSRPMVVLIDGDSKRVLPTLYGEFDTILVDGDHTESGAMTDLKMSLRLLAHGGMMIFDDLDHPQHPYLREVATDFAAQNGMGCDIFSDVHMGVATFMRRKKAP